MVGNKPGMSVAILNGGLKTLSLQSAVWSVGEGLRSGDRLDTSGLSGSGSKSADVPVEVCFMGMANNRYAVT